MLKKMKRKLYWAWAQFEVFTKLVCSALLCASFDNHTIVIISLPITVNTMVITVASGEKALSEKISDEHNSY